LPEDIAASAPINRDCVRLALYSLMKRFSDAFFWNRLTSVRTGCDLSFRPAAGLLFFFI